ncbi:LysR family transcriptional regulator [Amycolatopsis ultiminotia]
MYKFQHLETLRAVVRTGSFATAARDLGYTSSAVSQQIAALEKATGLVLFEREARGIRTTAAATTLVGLGRNVLAGLAELEAQARLLATGAIGGIRLGSFPTASERVVPAMLSGFARAFPKAEISLAEGEPDELLDLLLDGGLDLAFVYEYGLTPRCWPDGTVTCPLLREDLLLLTRADDSAAAGVELSELSRRSWITSREGTAGADSVDRLCAVAGFTPRILYRSNNYDVVRELVAATGGVAILPALGHRADPRITARPVVREAAHRRVLIVHRAGSTNPVLAEFLAMIRAASPITLPHVSSLVPPAGG